MDPVAMRLRQLALEKAQAAAGIYTLPVTSGSMTGGRRHKSRSRSRSHSRTRKGSGMVGGRRPRSRSRSHSRTRSHSRRGRGMVGGAKFASVGSVRGTKAEAIRMFHDAVKYLHKKIHGMLSVPEIELSILTPVMNRAPVVKITKEAVIDMADQMVPLARMASEELKNALKIIPTIFWTSPYAKKLYDKLVEDEYDFNDRYADETRLAELEETLSPDAVYKAATQGDAPFALKLAAREYLKGYGMSGGRRRKKSSSRRRSHSMSSRGSGMSMGSAMSGGRRHKKRSSSMPRRNRSGQFVSRKHGSGMIGGKRRSSKKKRSSSRGRTHFGTIR